MNNRDILRMNLLIMLYTLNLIKYEPYSYAYALMTNLIDKWNRVP